MARPRFHSQTESVMIHSSSSIATSTTVTTATSGVGGTGLLQSQTNQQQNNNHFINLMPVKDKNTNGRSAGNNNKSVLDELDDDIIPVKEELPARGSNANTTASSSSNTNNIGADKDVLIIDKDIDDKLKST